MSVINPNAFTTRPEIEGTFGVVTSTHWIATAVGMAILEKGGNAFDAAVATAFTLQVVEPHLNGPGGDVPVIVYDTRRGKPEAICGQGPAPAGATIAHYRGLGLDLVPGTGLLAACVPGTFETWMLLLRDYGTVSCARFWRPPSAYAQNGHPLVERANATIASVAQLFRDHWPTSAAVFLPNGSVPATGTLFANRALAATYQRILAEAERAGGERVAQIEAARKSWSQGFVAEAVDRFCRTQDVLDSSGTRHRGVLTGDDMARWAPRVEAPLTYDYGRYTVCKTGPWGQGPVMLQQLALLKGFDLDELDPCGRGLHPFAGRVRQARLRRPREVLRRSRFRRGADGDGFCPTPTTSSAASSSTMPLRWNCDRDRSPALARRGSARLRQRAGFGARPPARASRPSAESADAGDTVHFDIIDQAGNMVSATPSGGWLQSSPVIPELGFLPRHPRADVLAG